MLPIKGYIVKKNFKKIKLAIEKLKEKDIEVSLFIDPDKSQIEASRKIGAGIIELHTGEYANAKNIIAASKELEKLKRVAEYALSLGLEVNAGHGLNYANVKEVALIDGINELNIGHSIISRAVLVGLRQAVEEMLELIG